VTRLACVVVALLGVVTAGCGSPEPPTTPSPSPPPVELTVLAPPSLAGAFQEIASDFQTLNAGIRVTLSFGPSDDLAVQIQGGATADVFASISTRWMNLVELTPGITDRADIAQNEMIVVTPLDNPAAIESVEDLATPGVRVVVASTGDPSGDLARRVLARARLAAEVFPNIVSNEVDDEAVLMRIASGEGDAGVVFASNVNGAVTPIVGVIGIPGDVNVSVTYEIAVMATTPRADAAERFVAYVRSAGGQASLEAFGFITEG